MLVRALLAYDESVSDIGFAAQLGASVRQGGAVGGSDLLFALVRTLASSDTMRRVSVWLVASAITKGAIFRRVGVGRRRLRVPVPPMAYAAILVHTRYWQESRRARRPTGADDLHCWYGLIRLPSRQWDLTRVALSAFDQGLIEMAIAKVE